MHNRAESGIGDKPQDILRRQALRFVPGHSSFKLVRIVSPPDRMTEKSYQRMDHSNQQASSRPQHTSTFGQGLCPANDVIKTGKHGHRVENIILEREQCAVTARIDCGVGVNIHSDTETIIADQKIISTGEIEQSPSTVR